MAAPFRFAGPHLLTSILTPGRTSAEKILSPEGREVDSKLTSVPTPVKPEDFEFPSVTAVCESNLKRAHPQVIVSPVNLHDWRE